MKEEDLIDSDGVHNKTRIYLNPTLRNYGEELVNILNKAYCIASGIDDVKFKALSGRDYTNHLFCLYDTKKTGEFQSIINFVRDHPSYIFDYVFDDPLTGKLHMIVFRIQEEFENAVKYFLESKYSKMYSTGQIKKLFTKSNSDKAYFVVTKNPDYKTAFENHLNRDEYGSRIIIPDDGELDSKIELCEEIFNYEESS